MTFEPADLNLTDPEKGYLNFVLYTEARLGIASSSLNAELDIEASQTVTPHFQEWLSRLVRCEPNAMHCTLVEPTKIPALFHPCVTEDKDSPSAISGSGCVCRQTFYGVCPGHRPGRDWSAGRTEKSPDQLSGRGPSARREDGEGAGSHPHKHGGPDGRTDPTAPLAGATRAPGAARRREPAAGGAVPVAEAAAGSAPLTAVPRRPTESVVVRTSAPTPPEVSGHGGFHRASDARTNDAHTRRVEPTVANNRVGVDSTPASISR
ncbi:hypothetical protein ABT269_20875 [Streptomyces viridosporus]|uniref:hypothetical protein n=1 Tax=Streptomyces viridosporus TaxID=67581 RepID=UPI003331CBE2